MLARWDEVLGLARTTRERNALNGKLITEAHGAHQAALSLLLSAADQPPLYDAEGHTRAIGGGRMSAAPEHTYSPSLCYPCALRKFERAVSMAGTQGTQSSTTNPPSAS